MWVHCVAIHIVVLCACCVGRQVLHCCLYGDLKAGFFPVNGRTLTDITSLFLGLATS